MAHEDRDRIFEKALQRQLRSGGTTAAKANPQRNADPGPGACPDAEILASYHERVLTSGELTFWKGHIAGCARCQQILAQLELTDAIPLNAGQEMEELAEREREYVAAAPAQQEVRLAADAGQTQAAVAEVKALPTRAVSKPQWKWIVPAGAIAAGLFVWVALQENGMRPAAPRQKMQVADKAEARVSSPIAAAAPSLKDQTDAKVNPPPAKQFKKDAAPALPPTASFSVNGRDFGQRVQLVPKSQGGIAGGAQAIPGQALQNNYSDVQTATQSNGYPAVGGQQNTNVQPSAPKIVQHAIPPPLPPEQNALAFGAAPAPAPATQSVEVTSEATQDTDDSAAHGRSLADRQLMKAASKDKEAGARLVSSPAGKVVWRVGLGGFIAQSVDAGLTFQQQDSGVKTELVAASAASDTVCWVVGRSGTVLRTIDGGAHWVKLLSPIKQNLGDVRALDELHATIWDVPRRISFETTDGGATWNRADNN